MANLFKVNIAMLHSIAMTFLTFFLLPPVFASDLQKTGVNRRSTIYYVSPTGDDQDSGTSQQHAWKTIARVNAEHFNSGDRVLLRRGGIWHEQLNLQGGEPGVPITYSAYGTGDTAPVLDGADIVDHWSKVTDGVYRTEHPGRIAKAFLASNLLQEEIPLIAADSLTQCEQQAGTLFSDGNFVYIHLRDGQNPSALPVELSTSKRRYAVRGRGQSFVVIDGLALVRSYNSALIISPAGPNNGSTKTGGSNITVRNCIILNYGTPYERHHNDYPGDAGEGGIYISGWHDSAANQEQALPGIVVEGNTVGRFDSHGTLDYDRAGIYLRNTTGAIVKNNVVHTHTAMGIRLADNYNNRTNDTALIEENELTSNQGNISISGCSQCRVVKNNIHDSAGYGIGIGIGLFGFSLNTVLDQNTIHHLVASSDGLLYNGVDCNAGSADGIATGNHIDAVANYNFTLEADSNRPCSGWTLRHNILDASNNLTWNNKPTGRMGSLYVRDLSMNGLVLEGNTFIPSHSYAKNIALGSRAASDVTKDISSEELTQQKP